MGGFRTPRASRTACASLVAARADRARECEPRAERRPASTDRAPNTPRDILRLAVGGRPLDIEHAASKARMSVASFRRAAEEDADFGYE